MQVDEDMLKIKVMPVQQQTNSVDCRIFAMTFLTCILLDEDPKTQRFDEKLLRESLLQTLTEQHIRCYPTFWLELYCSCGQPRFPKDATVKNKEMAECSSCWKWFIECAGVSIKRSLGMKVLNEIAGVVDLTEKTFTFRTDSVES